MHKVIKNTAENSYSTRSVDESLKSPHLMLEKQGNHQILRPKNNTYCMQPAQGFMQPSLQASKQQPRRYNSTSLRCPSDVRSEQVYEQWCILKRSRFEGTLQALVSRATEQTSRVDPILNTASVKVLPDFKGTAGSGLWAAAEHLHRYTSQFVLPQLPSITGGCHVREDTQLSVLLCALERTQSDCWVKPSL